MSTNASGSLDAPEPAGASASSAAAAAAPSFASSAASSSSAGAPAPAVTEAEVVKVFQQKQEARRALVAKLGELEMELSEHRRVAETLRPMDCARRAYQLMNGVLVESSVGEVLPKVEANREGLANLIEVLTKQLREATADRDAYQERYKISMRPNEATLPALAEGDQAAAAALAL